MYTIENFGSNSFVFEQSNCKFKLERKLSSFEVQMMQEVLISLKEDLNVTLTKDRLFQLREVYESSCENFGCYNFVRMGLQNYCLKK